MPFGAAGKSRIDGSSFRGARGVARRLGFSWRAASIDTATNILVMTYPILLLMPHNVADGSIIFGIIIDTFAELREKKEAVDEMITGRCFICGIERFVFDQFSQEVRYGPEREFSHTLARERV